MAPEQSKLPGIRLGQKSSEGTKHVGHAIHKAGTHAEAEHAAEQSDVKSVKRPGRKAPSALPGKAGA